jgi:IclR family acetate operon transcriptional repressor
LAFLVAYGRKKAEHILAMCSAERNVVRSANSGTSGGGTMPEQTLGTEAAVRVADVLLMFTDGPSTIGVSHIARELRLSKAVVYRILQSLSARGMVALDPFSREYRLGAAAAALGARALRDSDLRTVSLDVLRGLRDETGETATLTAPVPDGRVYLDQFEGVHEIKMTVELGRRFPLHAGSSGKCMLAFLPPAQRKDLLASALPKLTEHTIVDPVALRAELAAIRGRGYATSGGERQHDAGSVAAPIFGMSGAVIGAVSVCGPRYRVTGDFVERIAPKVAAAAGRISQRMGWPDEHGPDRTPADDHRPGENRPGENHQDENRTGDGETDDRATDGD